MGELKARARSRHSEILTYIVPALMHILNVSDPVYLQTIRPAYFTIVRGHCIN